MNKSFIYLGIFIFLFFSLIFSSFYSVQALPVVSFPSSTINGNLLINGDLGVSKNITASYKSTDGTLGFTGTCTILGLTSITVKNGLITGCT